MADVLVSKTVKVRKNHKCHGCSSIIEKGNSALFETYTDDTIYNLYFCEDCKAWLKEKCNKCNECFELESSFEGFIKECKCKITLK